MPVSIGEYQLFLEDLPHFSNQPSPQSVSLPPGYRTLIQIISGVASIAQSSTSTPPRSLVLPSLVMSPSTPSSSVTVTSITVQPTVFLAASAPASSVTGTSPMIPGNLNFEEYLLVVQQQNSQGSQ